MVEIGETGVQGAGQRLAARDEGSSPSATVAVVFLVLLLRLVLDVGLDDLLHISDLDQYVLRFQVGVDNAALTVQVVQPEEDLLGDLLDQRHGDAPVVPSLDQAQQVLSQHFEHHADVHPVGAFVFKRIEQTDDVFAAGVGRVRLDDPVEQLDLVDGGFRVMSGGADDLQGDMLSGGGIAGQPDGREVTPAQFPHDDVASIVVGFAHGHGVVATLAVVLRIFLIRGRLRGVVARGGGGRGPGERDAVDGLLVGERGCDGGDAEVVMIHVSVQTKKKDGRGGGTRGEKTHPWAAALPILGSGSDEDSLVTMGFRSVPFLLFLPPLPLAAWAATLAICCALLRTACFISSPFIILRPSERAREGRGGGKERWLRVPVGGRCFARVVR